MDMMPVVFIPNRPLKFRVDTIPTPPPEKFIIPQKLDHNTWERRMFKLDRVERNTAYYLEEK